jgi:hypothetical protein
MINTPKYKIGDIIPADDFHREEYGLESVTITSINEKNKVYHWEAPYFGGKIHSGYFFDQVDELIKNSKDESSTF